MLQQAVRNLTGGKCMCQHVCSSKTLADSTILEVYVVHAAAVHSGRIFV